MKFSFMMKIFYLSKNIVRNDDLAAFEDWRQAQIEKKPLYSEKCTLIIYNDSVVTDFLALEYGLIYF